MEEMEDIVEQYKRQLLEEEKEELAKNSGTIAEFKVYCKSKGVSLGDDDFRYFQKIGVVAISPNLITNICQDIIFDKDKLVKFDDLVKDFGKLRLESGYVPTENYMLLASPFFRRGFHEENNYAPRFLELFLGRKMRSIKSIALDLDRVRIDVDGPMCFEFDTWYGPKFNDAIENISDGAVKIRPPLDLQERFISFYFADAYSLDVLWSTKDRIRTFQLEEFKTEAVKIENSNNTYFPVRYIHAEYDSDMNKFRHLDGAIHLYKEQQYFDRRDKDLNYYRNNFNTIKPYSIKLFKFNGEIENEDFIEFTAQFLTQNPLIHEYFTGKYPDYISIDFIRSTIK